MVLRERMRKGRRMINHRKVCDSCANLEARVTSMNWTDTVWFRGVIGRRPTVKVRAGNACGEIEGSLRRVSYITPGGQHLCLSLGNRKTMQSYISRHSRLSRTSYEPPHHP